MHFLWMEGAVWNGLRLGMDLAPAGAGRAQAPATVTHSMNPQTGTYKNLKGYTTDER